MKVTDAGYANNVVFSEESEAQAHELLDTIGERAQTLDLRMNANEVSIDGWHSSSVKR